MQTRRSGDSTHVRSTNGYKWLSMGVCACLHAWLCECRAPGFTGAWCELAPRLVVHGVVEEFKQPSRKPRASARRMCYAVWVWGNPRTYGSKKHIASACARLAWTARRLGENIWGAVKDWQFSVDFKMASLERSMYESDSEWANGRGTKLAVCASMHTERYLQIDSVGYNFKMLPPRFI